MSDLPPIIVVFDTATLRVSDLPALAKACESGAPVLPVFVLDDSAPELERLGAAARWWLHHSLSSLMAQLGALGSTLIVRRGTPAEQLLEVASAAGANTLHITRAYEPHLRTLEAQLKEACELAGVKLRRFAGRIMYEPEDVRTKTGGIYTVFSPFWKNCQALPHPGAPLPVPTSIMPYDQQLKSLSLDELALLPDIHWTAGMEEVWQPGRAGAEQRLQSFLDNGLMGYNGGRDRPDQQHVSALSPHIRFGEISVREVRAAVEAADPKHQDRGSHGHKFISELGWREFAVHLLFNFPKLTSDPLRDQFTDFPWQQGDGPEIQAWQKGQTGFPIVDAGMRQLWHTGYMHNRVRMVVASFLVKELLWHWRDGMAWFWDTLLDADLSNNTASWQWAAGCGADAAPYFRIFNPILQGEKFDPDGAYVRKWVPELRELPDKFIHKPWDAPELILRAANVRLGQNYPKPIVDRQEARDRALAAFGSVKKA